MGNTTTKQVGNFQQGVGIASADIGVIGSYIFAGFTFIIAFILVYVALRPPEDTSSNFPCGSNSSFNVVERQMGQLCPPDETCDTTSNLCKTKTPEKPKYYILLFALLAIVIGVVVVIIAKVTDKAVHSNRSFAQAYGTLSEANMISNIVRS